MARNSSATLREETSTPPKRKSHVIDTSLERRARRLMKDTSIPGQTRSLIQYALEVRDPYLAQIVQRVEIGEMSIDDLYRE